MAAACEVGISTWQNYEAGTSQPGPAVLARLVAMGVSSDWLLTGRPPGDADEQLLQDVVANLETVLAERNLMLPPEKKGRLVALLYQMFREMEEPQVARGHHLIAKVVTLAS